MGQPLPYTDFRWLDDVENFDVMFVTSDYAVGYVLEMDLEYPQYLHDAHTDLPFYPTRNKSRGKRQDKLLATLCDKTRYVIYYRNLQCVQHELRLTKIHRILQFAQSSWFCDYIEFNVEFRNHAQLWFRKKFIQTNE